MTLPSTYPFLPILELPSRFDSLLHPPLHRYVQPETAAAAHFEMILNLPSYCETQLPALREAAYDQRQLTAIWDVLDAVATASSKNKLAESQYDLALQLLEEGCAHTGITHATRWLHASHRAMRGTAFPSVLSTVFLHSESTTS